MSPVATITQITRPEHAVEAIAQILKDSTLPVEVLKYDDAFVQSYPAVQVMSGGFEKMLHGTHTWALAIRADIYIMHAQLSTSRQTRNLEDLELATQVVALLENQPIEPGSPNTDITLGRRVIAGWVEREQPGRMPPSGITKGKSVIGTLITWYGTNEGRF